MVHCTEGAFLVFLVYLSFGKLMNRHENKRHDAIRRQKLREDKETLILIKRGMRRCNMIRTGNLVIDTKLKQLYGDK